MTDRPKPDDTIELERALTDLGHHLAHPPTPPLARRVSQRLADRPATLPGWRQPFVARLALALLVALLALGALLLAWPAARTTVADRIGLPGIEIVHLPAMSTATPTLPLPPSPMPTPTLAPPGERLQLGRRATLAEARSALAFVIRLPDLPGLGGPDELYLSEQPVPRIALVYHARPRLAGRARDGRSPAADRVPGQRQ
jgi:hypothetical protein